MTLRSVAFVQIASKILRGIAELDGQEEVPALEFIVLAGVAAGFCVIDAGPPNGTLQRQLAASEPDNERPCLPPSA